MKIAYLSESRIPSREANSVHVMKMCQALARLGHEVHLMAIHPGGSEIESDLFAYYGVDPAFRIVRQRLGSSGTGRLRYSLLAAGTAKRLRVDAAIGRDLRACGLAALQGIPTVWDTHMGSFLDKPLGRWAFRRLLRLRAVRGVTTNCETLRQAIEDAIPESRSRVFAVHNGADPIQPGTKPAEIDCDRERLQVGYVGQLYPGKGLEMIRALAVAMPAADFNVVGGNEIALEGLRADSTLPSNVKLHGYVPPRATQRYALAFDVLLAPYQKRVEVSGGSDTAAWMSPLKLFEYMAAGKPIICSNLPVLREIVTDGADAILVPPDEQDRWVEKLRRLADDAAERDRLGAAAQATLLARFTWDRRAQTILNLLGAS